MSIRTLNLVTTQIVIQNIKTKPNAKQINLIVVLNNKHNFLWFKTNSFTITKKFKSKHKMKI